MPLLKNNGSHLNHQPDLQKFPSLALAPAIAHNGFPESSKTSRCQRMPKDSQRRSMSLHITGDHRITVHKIWLTNGLAQDNVRDMNIMNIMHTYKITPPKSTNSNYWQLAAGRHALLPQLWFAEIHPTVWPPALWQCQPHPWHWWHELKTRACHWSAPGCNRLVWK